MSNRYVWSKFQRATMYVEEYDPDWEPGFFIDLDDPISSIVIDYKIANSDSDLGTDRERVIIANPDDSGQLSYGDSLRLAANQYFSYWSSQFIASDEKTVKAGSAGARLEIVRGSGPSGTHGVDISLASGRIYTLTWEYGPGVAIGTTTNASSSTYPPCNAAGRITSICAVLPVMRRCYHGK